MVQTDEDALVCDLAETYRIFNYREMPLRLVATLASGLRDDSRIKKKISGINVETNTILLASIVDKLSLILWTKTKDGQKNRNRPDAIVNKLLKVETRTSDIVSFQSGQGFEEERNKLLGKEATKWQQN